MSGTLTGRVALVTGAARGMGACISAALAAEGCSVALLDLDRAQAALDARVSEIGSGAMAVMADITSQEAVARAFAAARERFGRIDILVNNAGMAESAPFGRTDLALWQKMIAVNLTGTYLCAREAYGTMAKQDYGRIVNISSTAGLTGIAYVTAYCAAKHGVIGLTRSLALEAAKTNVTVNAICPGYTETDLVKDAIANIIAKTGKSEAEARAALVSGNPQGRMIQPSEVANAVLWLCLPASQSVTGQAIAVAGGEVM